jgi:predicted NBD/HSP70 family sugar kinase
VSTLPIGIFAGFRGLDASERVFIQVLNEYALPMSDPRSTPARQPSLRGHNLALVLREVAARGELSRARIAAATGLTKATVSTLVDALAAAGLLRELGPDAAVGVGRPGSSLALAVGPVGVGLEINVDYLATCTVDLTGAVRRRALVAEDFRTVGVEAALSRAAAALRSAVDDAWATGGEVAGVSVAVPGLVESSLGLLRVAPNLGWRDVPVLDELAARAVLDEPVGSAGPDEPAGPAGAFRGVQGIPMRLDNEANLAAVGELWSGGHLRADSGPLKSFLYVSGEIGVGAAIVLDGVLFGGMRGFSGEIGHLPLDREGPACRCGARGCLEQYAGQEAVLRRAGLVQQARTTTGRPDGPVQELLGLARAGDPRAVEAIREAGDALGTGIAVAVNLVDVDTVVLGGLYALLAPWLLEPVQEQLHRRVLAADWDPVRVLVSRLGAEGAVHGAAISVVQGVIDDPAAWIARARTSADLGTGSDGGHAPGR